MTRDALDQEYFLTPIEEGKKKKKMYAIFPFTAANRP